MKLSYSLVVFFTLLIFNNTALAMRYGHARKPSLSLPTGGWEAKDIEAVNKGKEREREAQAALLASELEKKPKNRCNKETQTDLIPEIVIHQPE